MEIIKKQELSTIFWTTIVVSFVLLIHNGTEPLFLSAYAGIALLIAIFLVKKSLWPLVLYLLVFGFFGRYTRYFRETYASDTLLAIRDYIGYFLAGKNVYREIIWAQSGLTPFTYLPFSLLWYIPAQILSVDLRFFEMMVSGLVPVLVFMYGYIKKQWAMLPVVAVVSLTPFLLDLSSDGSNDNSAIFLLLSALVFLVLSVKRKSSRWAIVSAVGMGLAFSFKHYLAFFAIFFVPFLLTSKQFLPIPHKKYLVIMVATIGIICLPFILASPTGFWKSLFFIEIGNFHTTWGWNIWVALRDGVGITATKQQMWLVRTAGTAIVTLGFWKFYKLQTLGRVYVATALTLLVYLIFSNWTTYAYFTFLVPVFALAAIEEIS